MMQYRVNEEMILRIGQNQGGIPKEFELALKKIEEHAESPKQGDLAKATELARRSLAARESILEPADATLLNSRCQVARLAVRANDGDTAIEQYERVLAALKAQVSKVTAKKDARMVHEIQAITRSIVELQLGALSASHRAVLQEVDAADSDGGAHAISYVALQMYDRSPSEVVADIFHRLESSADPPVAEGEPRVASQAQCLAAFCAELHAQ